MFTARAVPQYDLPVQAFVSTQVREDGCEELDVWEWWDWLVLALLEQFPSLWI